MTTAPATTTPAGQTYQTLANAAGTTFNNKCVVCHGADGAGTDVCPVVLWGSQATLGSYNSVPIFKNGEEMLNYISTKMPLSAPGSLTKQQYEELLAFILLKDNKVTPTTVYDASKLSSISIP